MAKELKVEFVGNHIRLTREQWKGKDAYITNYPGLLDEVKKYTWTYTGDAHTYLRNNILATSLHKFVLDYLYGKEKIDEMIGESNIIEHLDNNGLNCTYENLHILSSDLNKAKAFSVDKEYEYLKTNIIPAMITDVYYNHNKKIFQMQVTFNKDIVFNINTNIPVECFIFHYDKFNDLFIDWLYFIECIKEEKFDISKHHSQRIYVKEVSSFQLKDSEKDAVVINRDGKCYLKINTDPNAGPIAFINHKAYEDVE